MTSVNTLFCKGAYLIRSCAIETTRERTWLRWRTNGYSPIHFCEPYWWRIRWTPIIFASSCSRVLFPLLFPFYLNFSCPDLAAAGGKQEILLWNNACYCFNKAFVLFQIEYYIKKQSYKPHWSSNFVLNSVVVKLIIAHVE